MLKRIIILIIITLSTVLSGCGGGGGGGGSGTTVPKFDSGDNEISDFRFTPLKNSTVLSADAVGEISGESITVTVPHGVSVAALIAEYVTNSTDVEVNEVLQVNGETANDFSSPVDYKVMADDGSERVYTVTVVEAPSTDKKILGFTLNGTEGVIDEVNGTIEIAMPPKSSLVGATASFSALCSRIEVNGVEQVSGVTLNDFTSPLVYSVFAEDGSSRVYTVKAEVLPAPWKEITSFAFRKSENPLLPFDVTGVIEAGTILLELPYGSSLSDLVAYFVTTGERVMIGETEQLAGVTVNSYGEELIYRIIAEDGSEQSYHVSAAVAKSDSREITEFRLDGEIAVIDQGQMNITIDLPESRDVTSLIAGFVTTGVSVTVNGVEQVSGVTPNDYSYPVIYRVTADNNSTADYTVSANKNSTIPGLWNFEYADSTEYTLFGAVLTEGLSGNALQFDGYDDYVLVPDSDVLTLSEAGTIEVVLKVIAHTPYAGIVHKGVMRDFSDEAYSLQYWGNDGTLRFLITGESGVYSYTNSASKLVPGEWYHITATWDLTEVKLYINGALAGSSVNNTGPVRDSDGGLVIGAQLTDQLYNSTYRNIGFNGIIDRVQLFSSALDSDQVLSRYNTVMNQETSALTAFMLKVVPQNRGIVIITFVCLLFALTGFYIFNRIKSS
ncbi:MAG TPA: LamG domain-containing protein [Spirochaetota bacterium]|nr:LamG domain-containing protein [Spirochaetota bacterium]HPJ34916.1 LamG domain-containing protein [Spirochaetota bacterium]